MSRSSPQVGALTGATVVPARTGVVKASASLIGISPIGLQAAASASTLIEQMAVISTRNSHGSRGYPVLSISRPERNRYGGHPASGNSALDLPCHYQAELLRPLPRVRHGQRAAGDSPDKDQVGPLLVYAFQGSSKRLLNT